jgi:hypothetical protein
MERERMEGTPKDLRTKTWIQPNRQNAVLMLSLAAAGLVAAVMIGGYFGGVKRTLSPGTVVSQHASFDLKCQQCHEPGRSVTAVRCERCHDPAVSDRLTHASHILLGTGDPQAMAAAEERPCQSCHVEHRGRSASLRTVDDRECGSCHKTTSGGALRAFADHPEFAVIRAAATPSVGIKFDHERHLRETKEKLSASCTVCHEQTPDRKAFVPITFDRHCVSCHTKNGLLSGETESIPTNLVVLPQNVPAQWIGNSKPRIETNPDDTVTGYELRHKDGWVLYNAFRLRSGIDPDGEESERQTLRGQLGYLEALLRARSIEPAPADALAQAITTLQTEIAAIDAKLATPDSSAQNTAALEELAGTVRGLAGQLRGLSSEGDAEVQALADAKVSGSSSTSSPSPADNAALIERRKQQLTALLDAIEARSADTPLAKRAADLKARVADVSFSAGDADTAGALGRIDALEAVLRSLRSVPDPGLQSELARLDLERRYAQQRVGGGLAPDEFDGRRRELLGLLDQIDARSNDATRARSSALRQRLLTIRPGSTGDAELRRTRQQRQRQLDRLRLEVELRASPEEQEPVPTQDATLDRPRIEAAYQRVRSTLAQLDAAPAMEEAADETEMADRLDAFRSLLGTACLKCHDTDPSGARIARPRLAEPVMPRSIFNHAPHVTRAACESCHAPVLKSTLATQVNVPGAAVCATCHAPSKTRDTCATCHIYHPPSPAALVPVNP